jgi:hypothetical protein
MGIASSFSSHLLSRNAQNMISHIVLYKHENWSIISVDQHTLTFIVQKYVVYSESSSTELVEGHVREGELLTLASPTL